MDTYHWDILVTYHWDVIGCFIWDVPATLLGGTKRSRYDVATTSCCRVGRGVLYLHAILFTMHEKDTANKYVIRTLLNIYDQFFLQKQLTTYYFYKECSIVDIWHGSKCRSSCPKVFCKKSDPTNFGKFTVKNH